MRSELSHRFSTILQARQAFADGANISKAIREAEGHDVNPPHAIEIAYELQSGSYSAGARADPDGWRSYGQAIAAHLSEHLNDGDSLLDAGTGEMTSLISALQHLEVEVRAAAFDVSWSRIACGNEFVASIDTEAQIRSFVGDMASIPLQSNSVDVAMTVHALEPNGGREQELLASLMRVARKRLVLFEPCFEAASPEAQERMRSHGYVQGLAGHIEALGGELVSTTEFELSTNPLNPTWVFVVEPAPAADAVVSEADFTFACPITGTPLREFRGTYYSDEAGLAYPIIGSIPVLRPESAILASLLDTEPRLPSRVDSA